MTSAEKYMEWAGSVFEQLKRKLRAFCKNSSFQWDEDIFMDTILKVHDHLLKEPLEDETPAGFEGYTVNAFKMNLKRESQYARNRRRDSTVMQDDIMPLYDAWCNDELISEKDKLRMDLWKDYAALYLMNKVAENFDDEHFRLFQHKYLIKGMTFTKLQQETKVKGARQKVTEVLQWLRENVTKEEVRKAFEEDYKEIITE